jgi:hypothetical protein
MIITFLTFAAKAGLQYGTNIICVVPEAPEQYDLAN